MEEPVGGIPAAAPVESTAPIGEESSGGEMDSGTAFESELSRINGTWDNAPEHVKAWANGTPPAEDAPAAAVVTPPASNVAAAAPAPAEPSELETIRAELAAAKAELNGYKPVHDYLRDKGVTDGPAAQAEILRIRKAEADEAINLKTRETLKDTEKSINAAVEAGTVTPEYGREYYKQQFDLAKRAVVAESQQAELTSTMQALAEKQATIELLQETETVLKTYPALQRDGAKDMLYRLAHAGNVTLTEAAEQLNALVQGSAQAAVIERAAREARQAQTTPPVMHAGGSPIVPMVNPKDVKNMSLRDLLINDARNRGRND